MGFDFKTHTRNNKGKIVAENHYNMKVSEGVRIFERPIKSGLWYFEDGTPTKETEKKLIEKTAQAAKAQREAEAAIKASMEEQEAKAKAEAEKEKLLTQLAAENLKLKEQLEKATLNQGAGQNQPQNVASNKEAPKKS